MKYQKLKVLFEVSRGDFEKGETVLDKGTSKWDVLTYIYIHKHILLQDHNSPHALSMYIIHRTMLQLLILYSHCFFIIQP